MRRTTPRQASRLSPAFNGHVGQVPCASPIHPCSRRCRWCIYSASLLPGATGDFRHGRSFLPGARGMAPNPARRKALALLNHLGFSSRILLSEQYCALPPPLPPPSHAGSRRASASMCFVRANVSIFALAPSQKTRGKMPLSHFLPHSTHRRCT